MKLKKLPEKQIKEEEKIDMPSQVSNVLAGRMSRKGAEKPWAEAEAS